MSPTPPHPGTSTPRRVQWASTDNFHSPPTTPHALDEMAQDVIPTPPSGSPSPGTSTLLQALHTTTLTDAPDSNPYVYSSMQHTYPPSTPSSSTHTSPSSSTPFLPRRTHALPGEVFIDPLESAGLPLSSRQASGDSDTPGHDHAGHVEHLAAREAAGVVRAHTKRWGVLGRRRHHSKLRAPDKERENRSHTHRRAGRSTDAEDEKHHSQPKKSWWHFHTPPSVAPTPHHPAPYAHTSCDSDLESHHPPHASQPKLGSGVLGALLALYGHDHEHDDHAASEDESDLSNPDRPWIDSKHKHKKSLGHTIHSASSSTASLIASMSPALIPPALKPKEKAPATMAGADYRAGLAPDLKRGYGLVRYRFEDGIDDVLQPPPTVLPLPQTQAETESGSGEGSPRTLPRLNLHLPRRTRSTDFNFTRGVGGPVEEDHEGEVASKARVDGEEEDSPDTLVAPISASSPTETPSSFQPTAPAPTKGKKSKRWTGVLKELPLPLHGAHLKGFSLSVPGTPFRHPASGPSTPGTGGSSSAGLGTPEEKVDGVDYFGAKWMEEQKERERKEKKEMERREKEKRRKRKKAAVYITRHVAAILQRQEFILKLARAMMMFGGPSHRLVAQIQSTARVLELELSCMYLPDVLWISFEDNATGTSNVKFIRQGSALDLGKLGEAHGLYWDVIHDAISVSSASASLDTLMRRRPVYNFTQLIVLGGMCSASICSVSFNGSFLDCLVSFPLGALLVTIQLLSVRNELYGNVFEITVATLLSFLSAALASTRHFCYSAVASSSVVLILPGFIVLCGSLEVSSRSLVAGAVRLCYALMYSLFLGFGLSIGAELYQTMVGQPIVGAVDYMCHDSHDTEGGWWQRTPSLWWAFLTVPSYSLFLSLRFGALWRKKELLLLVAISCIGWVTNHFVGTKFPNQSDISAAVGAFAVGFVSNLYGRFFEGNAFVVMITGILFQLPSGLGNGGLFNFVVDQTSGSSSSYLSGFNTALQLISTSVGLTVGLGISLVVVHPIQSRRRAAGVFSL
ncbi:hypothetical protein DFH29DRAFT_889625 [Suillus ampliporus]|nr:hypothetical protein DFH29DRAFT_889625 [Suillus ampliporus]